MTGQCFVPVAKVKKYLLDPNHPDGGAKCAFFTSFGFNQSEYKQLFLALAQHFIDNTPSRTIETPFGRKLVVRGKLTAPDGRRPAIQSIWIVSPPDHIPRFITAVPRGDPPR